MGSGHVPLKRLKLANRLLLIQLVHNIQKCVGVCATVTVHRVMTAVVAYLEPLSVIEKVKKCKNTHARNNGYVEKKLLHAKHM